MWDSVCDFEYLSMLVWVCEYGYVSMSMWVWVFSTVYSNVGTVWVNPYCPDLSWEVFHSFSSCLINLFQLVLCAIMGSAAKYRQNLVWCFIELRAIYLTTYSASNLLRNWWWWKCSRIRGGSTGRKKLRPKTKTKITLKLIFFKNPWSKGF